MRKTEYRADIDGLRAIAVLSVLANHISERLLPGGFIGVDIFFVISGFLITSQIYTELKYGSFSIKNFYKRRINRIVPALAGMIAFTLAAGYAILSPKDLSTLASSSFYSITGLSNVYFWREYGNYFSGNTREAPLLHTWSLGVEEQFYLIWPLLIAVLTKYLSRHIAIASILFCGVFLTISEVGVNTFASASYYLLPSRFFELAMGGTLALLSTHKNPANPILNTLLGSSGALLIALSLIFINKKSNFPGLTALPPCLGTVLLIWSGYDRNTITYRILSTRGATFFGRISYSLYLWHWPPIAYLAYLNINITGEIAVGIFVFSTTAAWLSWKYIEVPLRKSGTERAFAQVFTRRLLLPSIAIAVLAIACAQSEGFPKRFDPRVSELEAMVASKPNEERAGCHVPTALYATTPNQNCRLGQPTGAIEGIMIGDSYANHFTGMIDELLQSDGLAAIDYTMDGCPPILDFDTNQSKNYSEKCKSRNNFTYNHIQQQKYKFIILAAHWPTDINSGNLIRKSIARLASNPSTKIIIILENSEIKNASSCPVRNLMYKSQKTCMTVEINHAEYWQAIRNEYPNISFIDPNKLICKDRICSPMLNDHLLYRDDGHLNMIGSRLLGKILISEGFSLKASDSVLN